MSKEMVVAEDAEFDLTNLLNLEVIRTHLLLKAAYLLAYESLKSTIVQGVAGVFVWFYPEEQERVREAQELLPAEEFEHQFGETSRYHQEMLATYRREVGIDYHERDRHGLWRSCQWLQREGVLTEDDLQKVKTAKAHRNTISHELPTLLLRRGADDEVRELGNIMAVLRKVEPFFARIGAPIPEDVPDEAIFSGGQIMISRAFDAVLEYLNERMEALGE